ncbi:hypothetical protein CHLNCDRAFT_135584 [Chlorella variabilis]|uniref:Uncharacterized protein n=1 Tax=Chlorella variabilis TaxID=554065 RepID=E1ZII4_CHLVA|nr:hypothetical protein CHLNCDRAFT_135584 [Chlorella variabilis]EFN54338.1 hypothetical protein CHLNCDRAFT_135584 [Chlorella variabilis]|eukprot:XP_005846440.1 hypothetical protein CHLNCDRAFT_135584 [Chlorella variabilis]
MSMLVLDLVKKVGKSVSEVASKAVEALAPSEEKQERVARRESERRQREEIYRPEDAGFGGGLVGGLLGKAVGSMLRGAVGALGEQLREAQEQVADVQARAARVIESSSQLRQKLGGSVQVGAAFSQSSSTAIINGRTSRRVTLLMPVAGGGRVAQAQVQYVEGDTTADQLSIAVRLPSGEVVQLDGGSSPGGQIIDVSWQSVDDK